MADFALLLGGILCAAAGGELFVRGTVGLAHWARISPGIIAATVAAFATSSPELSVSVNSALEGKPAIALGDALGSNVVNIALILGLALSLAPLHCPQDSLRRDFPVALAVPVITGALFLDGVLSRLDGFLLLSLFLAWCVATVIEARRQRSAAGKIQGESNVLITTGQGAAGMILLVVAGRLIVTGATGIAATFGVDEFVIGATVVAIGTSAPELATTIVARLRRHDEVGLGTILGSNIFNGLLIVAVASILHPIAVRWQEAVTALIFGLAAVALSYPRRSGLIGRRRGFILLALYAAYLTAVVQWLPA